MATGTPYADSDDPVNSAMYDKATSWQGHSPYGWGRYFLTTSDNGTGGAFYNPSTENSFFHDHALRLLPIAYQGIYTTAYTNGHDDAQSNLKAVLAALGGDATTPFYAANGTHYCAFMLDCESINSKNEQINPPYVFTDYLHGWLEGMTKGVKDTSGNLLTGWPGVYSSQSACNTWTSLVDCASTYGIRPEFVVVASYIDPVGTTPPPSLPAWDTAYTSTKDCVGIGQATTMWQYAGDAKVDNGTYTVDLDVSNPSLDFHTALGQYAPIPN